VLNRIVAIFTAWPDTASDLARLITCAPSNRQHPSDTGEQGISKFATNQVKDRLILTRNFGDHCTAMTGDFYEAASTGDSTTGSERRAVSKPTFDHQRHPQKNERCTGVIPRVFAITVQQWPVIFMKQQAQETAQQAARDAR